MKDFLTIKLDIKVGHHIFIFFNMKMSKYKNMMWVIYMIRIKNSRPVKPQIGSLTFFVKS